jgi:dTDP-glucose 4,6-dehydratase
MIPFMAKHYLFYSTWHNRAMRKIVTGGAGFIGSNYLRQVVSEDKDTEYVIVDSLTYAGRITNIEPLLGMRNVSFVQGNIADRSLVSSIIKTGDTVLNFAAESHVDRSINSGYEFVFTNVIGTQVLLDACLKAGGVKFVQISTDEVYGSIEEGSWDEEFPLRPNSPYSASKAAADLLCLSYFHTFNLDVRITRCSNNYGPNQYPEKLVPFFIKRLLAGQTVPLYGTGANVREWIHVDDHIQGIKLVEVKGSPGEIYNLGSGEHFTNLEIAHLLIKNLELPENRIVFVEDRKGHDLRYSLNILKAKSKLGFEPKIRFERGLIETIEWYKRNPQELNT